MPRGLSDKTILALKPALKRYEVRDAHLPGFGVRVSASGQKSLFVAYRYGTEQRRITLGKYPITTLAQARQRAMDALRKVYEGIDPSRIQKAQSFLTCDVLDDFIEKYAKRKTKGWKATRALLLREIVGPFGQRDIRKLLRSDIIGILDDMVARGANAQANRFLSHIRKMLNWCVERGIVDANPANGIKQQCKEHPRQRVLNDDELSLIIPACREAGYPFGDLFLTMLLTAQRRGEVSGMRWSELDLTTRVWNLPSDRVKNARAHTVPLSPPVLRIIENVPRIPGSDFVFTTTGRSGVSGWGKPFARLTENAAVHDWRLHDLRRTAASGMARQGIAPHVVEKVLNHISGIISGVAAVYNRYGYESETREALEKWGVFIDELG